ncbi:MAG: DUF4837 family protein [Candidatus Krumholzibacteriota bacterium]|nr:DUF4837 family protein [Candidatus Krumholzibacteriota bacterium]
MNKKTFILIFITGLALNLSCQRSTSYPPAGSYGDIVLVTESGTPGGINDDIIRTLQHKVDYYSRTELQFKLRMIRAADISDEPATKNMVIYGVVRSGMTGDLIENFIGTAAVRKVLEGKDFIFKKSDYPVTGQLTVIVTAPTRGKLAEIARKNGAVIRGIIEKENRKRLRRYLLKKEKKDVENNLRIKYGFNIGVSFLYDLNQDRPDLPGVELVRKMPHRGITISWQKWDNKRLTIADSLKLYNIRAVMAWHMYNKDVMRKDIVSFRNEQLGPYEAVVMEGYWEKKDELYGGPFRCFFICNRQKTRLWIIDLLVYAPGFKKHRLLRELHAIAETFRY